MLSRLWSTLKNYRQPWNVTAVTTGVFRTEGLMPIALAISGYFFSQGWIPARTAWYIHVYVPISIWHLGSHNNEKRFAGTMHSTSRVIRTLQGNFHPPDIFHMARVSCLRLIALIFPAQNSPDAGWRLRVFFKLFLLHLSSFKSLVKKIQATSASY